MNLEVKNALDQAIEELRRGDLMVEENSQLVRDLKYLIVAHEGRIVHGTDMTFAIYASDNDLNQMRSFARIGLNEETDVSSSLTERLLSHKIILGTILSSWNTTVPDILVNSDSKIKLYDLSKYEIFYDRRLDICLIDFMDGTIGNIVGNTSCISKTVDETLEYLIVSKLCTNEVLDDVFKNKSYNSIATRVNVLEKITGFLRHSDVLAKEYVMAAIIDLFEDKIKLLNARTNVGSTYMVDSNKETLLNTFGKLLGINQELISSAQMIYDLSKNKTTVANVLKNNKIVDVQLPSLAV